MYICLWEFAVLYNPKILREGLCDIVLGGLQVWDGGSLEF